MAYTVCEDDSEGDGYPSRKGKIGLRCQKCNISFGSRQGLLDHYDDGNHHYCAKCILEFASLDELQVHWVSNRLSHLWMCPICYTEFNSKGGLQGHTKQMHRTKQSVECPGCHEVLPQASALIQHIERNICAGGIGKRQLHERVLDSQKGRETFMSLDDKRNMEWGHGKITGWGYRPATDIPNLTHATTTILSSSAQLSELVDDESSGVYAGLEALASDPGSKITGSGLTSSKTKPSVKLDFATLIDSKDKLRPEAGSRREARPLSKQEPKSLISVTGAPTGNLIGNVETGVSHPRVLDYPKKLDLGSKSEDAEKKATNSRREERVGNEIIVSWVCPDCKKSYSQRHSLVQHILSEAHSRANFRCPGCMSRFRSSSAFVQHCESGSCRVQKFGNYEVILSTTTGGIIRKGGWEFDASSSVTPRNSITGGSWDV